MTNKWSLYQSDKDYEHKIKRELSTFKLIVWLLFGSHNYIVTINKMRGDK